MTKNMVNVVNILSFGRKNMRGRNNFPLAPR